MALTLSPPPNKIVLNFDSKHLLTKILKFHFSQNNYIKILMDVSILGTVVIMVP